MEEQPAPPEFLAESCDSVDRQARHQSLFDEEDDRRHREPLEKRDRGLDLFLGKPEPAEERAVVRRERDVRRRGPDGYGQCEESDRCHLGQPDPRKTSSAEATPGANRLVVPSLDEYRSDSWRPHVEDNHEDRATEASQIDTGEGEHDGSYP